jgi:hypothetical protein
MNYVFFTEKDTNQSIAVNVRNVNLVREMRGTTQLVFKDNYVLYVLDDYLDVVARLNNP